MRLVTQAGGLATAVVAAWLALCAGSLSRADEASGQWTGELEARANYYYERSTRVNAPAFNLDLESPSGIRVDVNYLADIIASASVAQTGGGSDSVFTELRHGIGAGAGKTFDVGENQLSLNARIVYSTEPDYKSWIYGAYGSYTFDDKDTTLSLGVSGVSDRVYAKGPAGLTYKGPLHGATTILSISQVLSPVLTAGLSYQLVYLDGFLGNAYRSALIGPLPHPEAPPDERLRHNAEGLISWYVPASRTAFDLFMRLYLDSWSIGALTPEIRVYQALGEDWVVRARYRFYAQSKAYFALANGEMRYPVGYSGPITNDPKMSEFHSHQVGLRFTYTLNKLRGSFLGLFARAILDVSLDRQWSTNAFGNHWEGTLGGRIPF